MNNSANKTEWLFTRRPPVIDIIATTLIMILIAGLFYGQVHQSNLAKVWVVHTNEVAKHIQVFFGLLMEAELSHKRYLITGNPEDLEPYKKVTKESPGGITLPSTHFLTAGLNSQIEPNKSSSGSGRHGSASFDKRRVENLEMADIG
jgi:hypothetical protein